MLELCAPLSSYTASICQPYVSMVKVSFFCPGFDILLCPPRNCSGDENFFALFSILIPYDFSFMYIELFRLMLYEIHSPKDYI